MRALQIFVDPEAALRTVAGRRGDRHGIPGGRNRSGVSELGLLLKVTFFHFSPICEGFPLPWVSP